MNTGGNYSNRQSHITTGAAGGFALFGIVGAVIVANIVGFPEVEIGEAAVGGAGAVGAGGVAVGGTAALTADAEFGVALEAISEPGSSMAVGAVTAGGYGVVVGGAVGAALPSSGCR